MHTLLICMSAFADQLIICMDFGDIRHDLLYLKNLNDTLRKSTDVGMSNLFLIVKSENAK